MLEELKKIVDSPVLTPKLTDIKFEVSEEAAQKKNPKLLWAAEYDFRNLLSFQKGWRCVGLSFIS
jgi:hypothetical protein